MTEQEEQFIHFASCVEWLNNAWRLLQVIQEQKENPLRGAAFRFALVEYCKPCALSHGVTRKFKLDTSHVPDAYKALHKRITSARDQVHAHVDLKIMEAKLSLHDYMGQRYSLIIQNKISGLEELPNISEVIELIEGTLDNMYVQERRLEDALIF